MTPYLPSQPAITTPHSHYSRAPGLYKPGPGQWVSFLKTIPCIRHDYTEAILCLSGKCQKLHLIQNTHIYSYCMTQKQQMSICQGLMWPYGNRSGSKMCRRENLYCCPHDRSLIITNDCMSVADRGHAPDRTHPHPSQQLRWLIHRSSCFTGSLRSKHWRIM